MKKTWSMPHLMVLARGTPEEAVLVNCKNLDAATGPHAEVTTACAVRTGGSWGRFCELACDTQVQS